MTRWGGAAALMLLLLSGCHRVTGKSGLVAEFRHGWGYQQVTAGAFWLGILAIAVGALWMVRAFHGAPSDRGEATWGLFLVVFGLILVPTVVTASFGLWLCTGSC